MCLSVNANRSCYTRITMEVMCVCIYCVAGSRAQFYLIHKISHRNKFVCSTSSFFFFGARLNEISTIQTIYSRVCGCVGEWVGSPWEPIRKPLPLPPSLSLLQRLQHEYQWQYSSTKYPVPWHSKELKRQPDSQALTEAVRIKVAFRYSIVAFSASVSFIQGPFFSSTIFPF